MPDKVQHWTSESSEDFLYRIASDFMFQIETRLEVADLSQADLADRLQVSGGRVSQALNNPGNLTLISMVRFARALGLKLSVVAYDDSDSENELGPINAEVFKISWERAGKPRQISQAKAVSLSTVRAPRVFMQPSVSGTNALTVSHFDFGERKFQKVSTDRTLKIHGETEWQIPKYSPTIIAKSQDYSSKNAEFAVATGESL